MPCSACSLRSFKTGGFISGSPVLLETYPRWKSSQAKSTRGLPCQARGPEDRVVGLGTDDEEEDCQEKEWSDRVP